MTAAKLLKKTTTYLSLQKRFSVDTKSTIEAELLSGQKIQFDHAASMLLQRPNKMRAKRVGDLMEQAFYYDGKYLTLYNPEEIMMDPITILK